MIRLGHSLRLTDRQRSGGDFVLTPPTLAPVLSGYADPDDYVVNFSWTPSNKLTSDDFKYVIEYDLESSGWTFLKEVFSGINTTYDFTVLGDGLYSFRITPENSAGEGPSSNTVNVSLPGEFDGQHRLLEDGADRLIEDGELLILG